jgi:UDP-N-acetyl-D-mannosaminuronate dehydrogenase
VMRVGAIGSGHVGLVTCATLAAGHEVAPVEVDEAKVDSVLSDSVRSSSLGSGPIGENVSSGRAHVLRDLLRDRATM